jgi:hypothetical protein
VRKEELPDLVRFIRPAPGMNFISYSRCAADQLDQTIRAQIAYFTQMDQPFSWKVYSHDTPPDLAGRLIAAGFAPDDTPGAVMLLDLQAVPDSLLAPVSADIRRITRREELAAVIAIEEQVRGGNYSWMHQRLGAHLEMPGYLSMYVAYVDDRPACAGWTYFHPNSQFAGLWGGSTLVEQRKRGLYTAVLATRVQEARQRGYRFLMIDASPMSRAIVANHGFQLLTEVRDFEWTQHLAR